MSLRKKKCPSVEPRSYFQVNHIFSVVELFSAQVVVDSTTELCDVGLNPLLDLCLYFVLFSAKQLLLRGVKMNGKCPNLKS